MGHVNKMRPLLSEEILETRIFVIRGQKVMVDRDLAQLYQVRTKDLTQAVRRNSSRFPEGFMFRLSRNKTHELATNCGRFGTLKHSRMPPLVFTDYGLAMLSSVLRSPRAVRMNVEIIRIFIRWRRWALSHDDLTGKINELESKIENHDEEIRYIFDSLRKLLTTNKKSKRILGFVSNTGS